MTVKPNEQVPQSSAAGTPVALPPAVLEEKVHILVVDDRPDKLLAIDAALSELHQNVVLAHSGKEALRCLLNQDFAVILLDVNMPGMDGFETAALIRQRPRTQTTPIIFISALNDAHNYVTRGYSLGAVDYILSPVIPEILRAKVSVFVELYRKTLQIKKQADERANRIRAEAARAEAEAARERSAFLAEASNVLATSFDYHATFHALADLVIPRLADCCVIDVASENGSLDPIVIRHSDASTEQQLRAFRKAFPAHVDGEHGVALALQRNAPLLCAEFRDDEIAGFARTPAEAQALRKLGVCSYVVVPLRARGRTLGGLCLISTSERRYSESDIPLVEELAQRAGLALDNAGLYQTAQRARQEAERASQAKDQFLAMLSHELRTPLTPVLNAVALLECEECPESIRESLDMIRRNIELEARLIDDLLDLTRVSKGKVQLNLETVNAHELLTSTLEICQSEIQDKQIEVSVNMEAERCHLQADSARLQQVFWNLVKNAVKFTPAHGKLSVRTSNDESGRFCVEVADSGIGIEADILPRVFDAFEQGQGARFGGLGLGLAITKALVTLHRGEITAHSAGRNQGATFTVRFPTIKAPVREAKAAPVGTPEDGRLLLRLLLVEDHEDTQVTLSRLLRRRGYEVHTATTVADAIEEAGRFPFDVLISDMGLPDGSGIDLMERLSALGAVRGIALSGFGMEEDIQRSKAVGFIEHLTKPVDISRLDEALQRVGKEAVA